ncbi:hypothetical protein ACSBR1_018874 [Camellia fascicularis]
MAKTIVGPFVAFVVGRLGDVLIQKKNLLRGVSGQVKEMQRELNKMKCFLKDTAEKREEGDERVHNWVVEIKEAAYDAKANNTAIHKVVVEIESIKTMIASIRTSLETYNVMANSEGESLRFERQWLLRRSYPHIVEEDIVGLDDDIKTIAEYLVKEERQCLLVFIWGMGGLGKTTLAKKVYNHNDVRCHFDSFAWAFVSQQ